MIRHIVLFTARDHIDRTIEGLMVLTTIPYARRLEIARNRKSDLIGDEIDAVVYGEFDNEMELAAYKAHELYQESIRRVRPLRDLRFGADYSISTDPNPCCTFTTWSLATIIRTPDAGSCPLDGLSRIPDAEGLVHATEPTNLQHCLPALSRRTIVMSAWLVRDIQSSVVRLTPRQHRGQST